MFFNSAPFRALESGLDAAWTRQQLHTHNIANLETPGYKSKSLTFDEVLTRTQGSGDGKSYRARVVAENTESRPDGNNVSMEIEGTELYKSYVQYSMLMDRMKGQFTNYNTVLNCNMK